jgi:hypothetical protein
MLAKKRLIVLLFIVVSLVACGSADEVRNEDVTIENMDKIVLGDKDTGEGGTAYNEVVTLFGDVPPTNESTHEENGVTVTDANWYYDRQGLKLVSVSFVNKKAVGKYQEGLE